MVSLGRQRRCLRAFWLLCSRTLRDHMHFWQELPKSFLICLVSLLLFHLILKATSSNLLTQLWTSWQWMNGMQMKLVVSYKPRSIVESFVTLPVKLNPLYPTASLMLTQMTRSFWAMKNSLRRRLCLLTIAWVNFWKCSRRKLSQKLRKTSSFCLNYAWWQLTLQSAAVMLEAWSKLEISQTRCSKCAMDLLLQMTRFQIPPLSTAATSTKLSKHSRRKKKLKKTPSPAAQQFLLADSIWYDLKKQKKNLQEL